MNYQIVIAGFGGQGAVFLVKLLSVAAANKNQKCLGTENHGMSQRGGSVSCYVKLGEFYAPAMDEGQANLIIGLDTNEALRNLHFLNEENGCLIVNGDDSFPSLDYRFKGTLFKVDAFTKATKNEFPIQALNVYMLGIALARDPNFPFNQEEIENALTQMNAKMAQKNIDVLHVALADAKQEEVLT